jgi:TRAP-type C4-dicarboxylate transport system substrate-binding protein
LRRRRIAGVGGRSRLRTFALVGVVAVVAAGCTGGAGGGDKAGGGGEPVVLKLADAGGDLEYTPALEYFVNRVNELSGGELRLDVIYGWGNFSADAEEQAVRDVEAGKADLTWAGTRAFDTLGVESFAALQAPMLIDSYAVQDAVVKSDIPSQMLRGLDRIGVVGLAVLAASLPKVIAVHEALLGPADWRGITFQAHRSQVQADAIRALGARPTDTLGGLDAGLENGTIQGFAKTLLAYQLNTTEHLAPYVTANVNLWPGTAVLLANPGSLSRLSDQQRGWLRQAAQDAVARSTSLVDHEEQIVADVCRAGARFVNASDADLAALRQAFAPVFASLEQDPQTKAFIARIEELKASTPAGAPLAIPPNCSGSTGPPPTGDPIAGTWQTGHLTQNQVVRAFVAQGGGEKGARALFPEEWGATRYVVLKVSFQDGGYDQFFSADGGPFVHQDSGSYKLAGDGTFTLSAGGCTSSLRYDLDEKTLRLHMVNPWCDAYVPLDVASFPFTRSS